jgi:hypothetical protein
MMAENDLPRRQAAERPGISTLLRKATNGSWKRAAAQENGGAGGSPAPPCAVLSDARLRLWSTLTEQPQHRLRNRIGDLKRLLSALEQDLGPRQGRHLLGDIRVADGRLGRTDVLQCDLLAVDVGLDLVFLKAAEAPAGGRDLVDGFFQDVLGGDEVLAFDLVVPTTADAVEEPTTLLPRAPEEIELIPTLT